MKKHEDRTASSKRKSKLAIKKARFRQIYKDIGRAFCKPLKAEVLFTRVGWEHITIAKRRSKNEKLVRFELLPLAKKLLETTTTIQGKRFQDGHDHYSFVALMDGLKLTVIVRESEKKFYFHSVFKE